jgi:ATP-dependent helicase/nuclease subunit A
MNQWVEAFGLKDAQVLAATTFDRDVGVTAGAGSGKTRTLTARYLALLDQGCPPRALAAITFTEKAAREMRNRIRKAIAEWRSGACPPDGRARWEDIEAEIDTARIGTIHSLCATILRAHPAEAHSERRR